ncbi:MAG: DUF4824 family protein [Acidobacteria bacterium]|nr:MAG: DUF4824 family protein [Acidobacteriota bacterium]MCE7956698.1 DUF4824 family protein [Acidobacteria bacterium ACB2]
MVVGLDAEVGLLPRPRPRGRGAPPPVPEAPRDPEEGGLVRREAAVLSAGALVLLCNALLLASARRDRAGEAGPAIRLTERELPLEVRGIDATWTSLRIDWNADLERRRRDAGWFDRDELAALGFDTHLPAEDPEADEFYGWQPPREAWVVLEMDGEAARAWREKREQELAATLRKLGDDRESPDARRAVEAFESDRASRSRLFAVDAGSDLAALRARYPDPARWLVVRAVVAASCDRRWDPETRSESPPVLRGRIEELRVGEIEVPLAKRALLDGLAEKDREEARRAKASAGEEAVAPVSPRRREPRYDVLLRYGRGHTPWVEEVRPLAPPR